MAIVECSCKGENENCFKCSGSGKYDPEEDARDILKGSSGRVTSIRVVAAPSPAKPKTKKWTLGTDQPLQQTVPPERKPKLPTQTPPSTSSARGKEPGKAVRWVVPGAPKARKPTTKTPKPQKQHGLRFVFVGAQITVTHTETLLTEEEAALAALAMLQNRQKLVRKAYKRGVLSMELKLHSVVHGSLKVEHQSFRLSRELEPLKANIEFVKTVQFARTQPARHNTPKKTIKGTKGANPRQDPRRAPNNSAMADAFGRAGQYWGREEEKGQDATRDYWKLRDSSGQFGSYPSHDHYDE